MFTRAISFAFLALLILPSISHAQLFADIYDQDRAEVRSGFLVGLGSASIERFPTPLLFKGNVSLMSKDKKFGFENNLSFAPADADSLGDRIGWFFKYNFRSLGHLGRTLYVDSGMDYVDRGGKTGDKVGHLKIGLAHRKSGDKNILELAGGYRNEIFSGSRANLKGFYMLFRFDQRMGTKENWFFRVECEPNLVSYPVYNSRRTGFSSDILVGIVYRGRFRQKD